MSVPTRALIVPAVILLAACRSNNLLLGRVEATVAGHTVVVTDCYRTSVPAPHHDTDAAGDRIDQFKPCRDADVTIRGSELVVNGVSYGTIASGDSVTVDHGRVLVNDRAAKVAERR